MDNFKDIIEFTENADDPAKREMYESKTRFEMFYDSLNDKEKLAYFNLMRDKFESWGPEDFNQLRKDVTVKEENDPRKYFEQNFSNVKYGQLDFPEVYMGEKELVETFNEEAFEQRIAKLREDVQKKAIEIADSEVDKKLLQRYDEIAHGVPQMGTVLKL